MHTVDGVSGSISQLAKHFGVVSAKNALQRVNEYGWPVEAAVKLGLAKAQRPCPKCYTRHNSLTKACPCGHTFYRAHVDD